MIEIKKHNKISNNIIVAIAGIGEVGYALWGILDKAYETIPLDPAIGYDIPNPAQADQLHIAFPYNELFVEEVVTWVASLNPFQVVIHSTIIPGTMESLDTILKGHGFDCLISYSPCHCWAPHIQEHLMSMSKNLGSMTEEGGRTAAESLEENGMNVSLFESAATLEWAEIQFIWRTAIEQCWTNNLKGIGDSKELDFIQMGPAYTEIMNTGLSQMRTMSRFFPILSYNDVIPCDKHAVTAAKLALEVLPDGSFNSIITAVMDTFSEEI